MRLIYKPFAMIISMIAGVISKRVFRMAWGAVDDHEPPSATTEQASWSRVLGASVLRAVSNSVTRTTAERMGAKTFHWLTGSWPAKKSQRRR
ncbi:MAG TPA: DUF4235 domain-containing protein [Solirubrobacteraceae bacterium]